MRLVGPSSLGVLNTDPSLRLNATAAPVTPAAGPVALASQSGALGVAAMAEAARRGVGLSSFVSTGDKADLSGNDFLQYWEGDDATRVVMLYLESFGNPRRFGTIARRVATAKPIVAVKSGRRAADAGDAEPTRTRALLGAADVSVDALFEHSGVIRTDTVFEQLDVAALLASQPLPAGRRVGIVSNGRGPAISCADACVAAGLEPEEPVDLGGDAGRGDYARAIERTAPGVDALVAVFVPTLSTAAGDVAGALHDCSGGETTLLGAFMAQSDAEMAALGGAVPLYRSPVEAARALGRAARYASWRERAREEPPELGGVEADAAAAVIAGALVRGEGPLEPAEAEALLRAYGIEVARRRGGRDGGRRARRPGLRPGRRLRAGRPDARAARRRRGPARAAQPRRCGRPRPLAALVPAADRLRRRAAGRRRRPRGPARAALRAGRHAPGGHRDRLRPGAGRRPGRHRRGRPRPRPPCRCAATLPGAGSLIYHGVPDMSDRQQKTIGEMRAAISREMVRLQAEYYGKGPTKAKTYIVDDLVVVVLEETFTRAEKTLAARGERDAIQHIRRRFQQQMAESFTGLVEQVTGRKVRVFLSETDIDSDVSVETFLLAEERTDMTGFEET